MMIPDARTNTLMPSMERMILPDRIVCTDSFGSHDALDVSSFHHMGVNHSEGMTLLGQGRPCRSRGFTSLRLQ